MPVKMLGQLFLIADPTFLFIVFGKNREISLKFFKFYIVIYLGLC